MKKTLGIKRRKRRARRAPLSNFHGRTENDLSNDSVGGMKNHLLNAGCLFMMHFQLTCFPPRQDILKRTLPHYKACFHCQVEKKDVCYMTATNIKESLSRFIIPMDATVEHIHSFRGRPVIPCFYNLTTSVFVDTRHFVMSSRGSVRIHEESSTIAVTDGFCPRQIGSSVDIYRRQAEQISTCNTCRSEVFNVGSHILRSNPSSVRMKVNAHFVKQIEPEAKL